MCEPYNLEYGRVEGFRAPEPDPVAPLMDLKFKDYNDQTRRQLAKGFSLVKKYRTFMEDPMKKRIRDYAKSKTKGETQSKTEDPRKVEEAQGSTVRDNTTTNPNRHVSPRSRAPSPPSHRNTPSGDLTSNPTDAEGNPSTTVTE